jgi:hypothetical protein
VAGGGGDFVGRLAGGGGAHVAVAQIGHGADDEFIQFQHGDGGIGRRAGDDRDGDGAQHFLRRLQIRG